MDDNIYYKETISTLKYEITKLRSQLEGAVKIIEEKQAFIDQDRMNRESTRLQMERDRQSNLRLLKLRNENELSLQAEMLQKNKVVADLTNKLKKSTKLLVESAEGKMDTSKKHQKELQEQLQGLERTLKDQFEDKLQSLKGAH